jgi:cysteine desulfurase
MRVYFDNAATTPVLPEVADAMCDVLRNTFGNPSSSHSFGREAKGLLETSRRTISKYLNCSPAEIFFTSGGTEADNMAFYTAVNNLKVEQIITTCIEHHAVGHTAEKYAKENNLSLHYLDLDEKGNISFTQLEELLSSGKKTFVSIMHANNEIGTLNDIKRISEICQKHQAYFHSDTVQTMGHYSFDLTELKIDFITCAAHKFHGPKGTGFLYVNKRIKPTILILGGAQERGFRAGTENMAGIVGLAKAMEIAYENLEVHQKHVQALKNYFIQKLISEFDDVQFNGETDPSKSLYTVLSCSFPESAKSGMLLFTLDLKGIACSGGSACSSGANKGSHVIHGIKANPMRPTVRFSFSHLSKMEEVDYAIGVLKEIYKKEIA